MAFLDSLKFDGAGLVPAVVQDPASGEVLMVGYMNRAAVERTLESGRVTFWSRSRQKFWVKGETSGHVLRFREMRVDCDADCLLVKAEPVGPACHEGYRSCFFRRVAEDGSESSVVEEREKTPEEIYGVKG
jgi:phosphoribosyl-AMP cyclohydrolase